ncbi:MAG: hypothetical protein IT544_02945 [Rhodobacteraceae bacterium]|nr:hypothetical protein [Paracoccaceae bacterium]
MFERAVGVYCDSMAFYVVAEDDVKTLRILRECELIPLVYIEEWPDVIIMEGCAYLNATTG